LSLDGIKPAFVSPSFSVSYRLREPPVISLLLGVRATHGTTQARSADHGLATPVRVPACPTATRHGSSAQGGGA
jgi:hypothetical protein